MSSSDLGPASESALVAADHDSLEDLLDRLWMMAGRAARLTIPPGSSLLLTASEFRVLKEVADRRGVALTLETEDPLRVQLAGLFGLPAVRVGGPLGPRPLPDPPADDGQRPGPRLVPTPPATDGHQATPGGSLPDLAVPPTDTTTGLWDVPGGTGDVFAPPPIDVGPRFREPGQAFTVRDIGERATIATPARAPAPPPPIQVVHPPPAPVVAAQSTPSPNGMAGSRPAPSLDGPATTVVSTPAGGGRFDELRAAARRATRERSGVRRRAILLAATGLVALLALAAAALVVVLPRATVTLDLKEQTLVAEVPIRVLLPGEEAAGELAVRGDQATVEVAYVTTVETSGVTRIGETAAGGSVLLANPTGEPVTIPAGTVGVGDTGLEVRFVEDVIVPAADGAAGQVEAPVEMVEPGTAGNLGAGELSGVLDSGVYFSNRLAPLEGGTDREGRGVAQADLDTLTARFEAELPALAEARLSETLPPGVAVVPNSLAFGEPELAFDRAAGEPGDTVTLTASVDVSGLTYRPDEVMARAEPLLRDALLAKLPPSYELDPATVAFSQPVSPNGGAGGGAEVVVTASGRAVFRFTDEERAALAEQLAGKSAGDAAEILQAVPAVDAFSVDYFPGRIVERMPRQADRIEIEIRD